MKRAILHILALAAAAVIAAPAAAQTWPQRPISLIVPFAAGGGTDAFARPLAQQLDNQLGMRVIVDNRAGAGGNTGAAAAARAEPDGYTFFVGATHHVIAPSMYTNLTYDLQKDFVPIGMVSQVPHVVVVHPQKVPAKTLPDLVASAKANPGKLNYGSAGPGTAHHLAGEMFKLLTGTNIVHVPYRGAGPAMQDLLAGQIDMAFDGLGSSTFYALWAPKGTPPAIVERMTKELQTALQAPTIREAWTRQGSEIPTLTGAEFGAFVGSEITRWAKVVKDAGLKLEEAK